MPNPFSPKQLKISVICPVYGKAYKTFPKFFQALDEQDFKNFEVIVSFDGPNRKGVKALTKMTKKYSKMYIRHIVNKWGGAPSARNHGAKEARGDILTFLDPDIYIYSDTFRFWINSFEKNDVDVVWGLYDILQDNEKLPVGGAIPCNADGKPIYWAFRFSNYCSGAFPIRKEAFVGWREGLASLQDWDMWIRMLKKDNFEGKRFEYYKKSFFCTDPPGGSGISLDSSKNWIARVQEIKQKNNIPLSDVCVTSLGAPLHGINTAKLLGYDYLPMPSFKPHKYKAIYLLGFYTNHPDAIRAHLGVFGEYKVKKIVHWIGTDIYQLGHGISVQTWKDLKALFRKNKFINLTEVDYTQKEMRDLEIPTKVIPLPPSKLYDPMPLPEKFTIGIYENPTQQLYEEELMSHIARAMPDIEFKFFGDPNQKSKYKNVEHLGWIDYDKWLPKLSMNLRITKHDGLPLTPVQFLTAGRNVVCNVPLKGAIQVGRSRKSIIEGIRKAQKEPLDLKWSRYWKKEMSPELYKRRIRRLI